MTRTSNPTRSRQPLVVREKSKPERVRERLLGEIAIGRLRPGDALPPEHRLAELLEVSRSTLRQTLGVLEDEGVISRVHGKGTYVAERATNEPASRTASFALIVPDVATGYYPSLVAGFDQAATKAGRPIVVCNTHNDVDKQASHLMRLIDQRVAGVLLNPSTLLDTPVSQIRVAQEAGIPIVLLHRGVAEAQAPVLELPALEIGRRAGRLLVEAGHRRVAYLTAHRYSLSEAFEQGFREALAEAAIDLPTENVIYYSGMTGFDAVDYQALEQFLEQYLKKALAGPDRPTGLFVSFDATAELVYLIASRMGLRIPQDLSIVCFGGARREGAIIRRLTAVTVDEADAAQQAVQMLMEMRDGRRPIQSQETIPMSLGFCQGQTCHA